MKFKCIMLTKKRIEEEIRDLCREAYIEVKYFLRYAISVESRVFYLKLIADIFRYLAQIETGQTLIRLMDETDKRYEKAMTEAQTLDSSSPLKLALALNYSCYKYEIEQQFD